MAADYHRIRQTRVRDLIRDHFHDKQIEFSLALGIPASTVSRWFMTGKHHQNIGDQNARKIEDHMKWQRGSLDSASGPAPRTGELPPEWPFKFDYGLYDRLSKPHKRKIEVEVYRMVMEFAAEVTPPGKKSA